MNTSTYRDVFDHLAGQGHLSAKERAAAETAVAHLEEVDDSASRLISAVAGLGAWLTMIFLVLCLSALEIIDLGDFSSMVVAVLLGAAAVGAHKKKWDRGVFASQLMLATSFAAQAVALVAMGELDFLVRALGMSAFCAAMYVLIDSRANRLFSAALLGSLLAAETGARGYALSYTLLFGVVVALSCVIFGARRLLPSRLRLVLRPAAYVGAILALGMSFEPVSNEIATWLPTAERIILALAAVTMLALAHLGSARSTRAPSERTSNRRPRRLSWAAAAVIALGMVTTPGVLCAALVVGLGLWRHRSRLVVLGATGLAVHLFTYYYQLDMTLLAKSGVLMASGLILLALRWVLELDHAASGPKEAR